MLLQIDSDYKPEYSYLFQNRLFHRKEGCIVDLTHKEREKTTCKVLFSLTNMRPKGHSNSMKSVYHSQPYFKVLRSQHQIFLLSVTEYYSFFVALLLSDHALLLKLFQEERSDVKVLRNGTYTRQLICGDNNNSSNCYTLNIQRVILCSTDGVFLYSRSILPSLIIPYCGYSLQFVLHCVFLYYNGHSISDICRSTGVGPRQLRRWLRYAEKNQSLIKDFLQQRSTQKNVCPCLAAFLTLATDLFHAKVEIPEMLYKQLCRHSHSERRWIFMLPGITASMQLQPGRIPRST